MNFNSSNKHYESLKKKKNNEAENVSAGEFIQETAEAVQDDCKIRTDIKTAKQIGVQSKKDEKSLFKEFSDYMPTIYLEELVKLLKNKTDNQRETASFIRRFIENQNLVWVYIGIAACWSVYNAVKCKGGKYKKDEDRIGYINAMKDLARLINPKEPDKYETINIYRTIIWSFHKESLLEIFNQTETFSAAEKVSVPENSLIDEIPIITETNSQKILVKLKEITEFMTKIDITYYKIAAFTTDPHKAIDIAFDNCGTGYSTRKFEQDTKHLKTGKTKTLKMKPTVNNISDKIFLNKKDTVLLEKIMKKTQIRKSDKMIRICLQFTLNQIDSVITFFDIKPEKIKISEEKVNALEP
jgi:hypothetical protein